MKLNGKKIEGANEQYIVIPRPDGNIVFKAVAILDFTRFEELCPKMTAPLVMFPGGEKKANFQDEGFLTGRNQWSQKKFQYTIIESLRNTPGLEWETVNYDDPNTWGNYETEFKASGFSEREIYHITEGCMEVNALSEGKLIEARNSFLLTIMQVQLQKS